MLPLQTSGALSSGVLEESDDLEATTAGLSALLREAVERGEVDQKIEGYFEPAFVTLVGADDEDEARAKKCGLEASCLAKLRRERGLEALAGGGVTAEEEGFRIQMVVALDGSAADGAMLREVELLVGGDEDQLKASMDRLARMTFDPLALRGSLVVEGSSTGAEIEIDGEPVGALPLEGPITGLAEGTHRLKATASGGRVFERAVSIRFRETNEVRVTLARAQDDQAGGGLSTLHYIGSLGLVGTGALLLAGGAMAGGYTLFQALQIQARAESQNLILPRDQGLLLSGQVGAVLANGLYALSAVLLVAGASWLGTALAFQFVGGEEEGGPS